MSELKAFCSGILIMRRVFASPFFKSLYSRVRDNDVAGGAAALAFYLTLSVFPALIVLISAASLLPIENVDQAILDIIGQSLPGDSAAMVVNVIQEGLAKQSHSLVSVSLLALLWAASTGMHAIVQRINRAYHVSDRRGFFRNRFLALIISVVFGTLTLAVFSLVVLGGIVQGWIGQSYGSRDAMVVLFAVFRWLMIVITLTLAFAIVYRFGPNVVRTPSQFTPGVVSGVTVLIAASIVFRHLASSLIDYNVMYGSIGAVIATMIWLYVVGWVVLLGAELNALLELRIDKTHPYFGRCGEAVNTIAN